MIIMNLPLDRSVNKSIMKFSNYYAFFVSSSTRFGHKRGRQKVTLSPLLTAVTWWLQCQTNIVQISKQIWCDVPLMNFCYTCCYYLCVCRAARSQTHFEWLFCFIVFFLCVCVVAFLFHFRRLSQIFLAYSLGQCLHFTKRNMCFGFAAFFQNTTTTHNVPRQPKCVLLHTANHNSKLFW